MQTIACPACKQALNVPTDRGTLLVTCARCQGRFGWSPPAAAPQTAPVPPPRVAQPPAPAAVASPPRRGAALVLGITAAAALLALILGAGAWSILGGERDLGPSHFEGIDPDNATTSDLDDAMEKW